MWQAWRGGKVQTGCGAKFEGQRPYRRPRYRRDYNFIMDPKEIIWEGLDWIALAQGMDKWWALVNLVMNLQNP